MALVNVPAPMTGTIKEVLCTSGDDVGNGQEIFILESMKMEIPVECPQGGRVAQILAEAGQHVEEGDPLLSLEA